MFLLSELLGRAIVDANGRSLGRLRDLVVRLQPTPEVVRLRVRRRRGPGSDIAWAAVAAVDEAEIRLTRGAELATPRLAEDELLLDRHVLDAQIVDVAGKRLTRVGDLELILANGSLTVTAAEAGARPVLRRLGLGFVARTSRSTLLEWKDLHLASHRGRGVQLATTDRAPSHSELVENLAPGARRKRFRLRWIRRRAPA